MACCVCVQLQPGEITMSEQFWLDESVDTDVMHNPVYALMHSRGEIDDEIEELIDNALAERQQEEIKRCFNVAYISEAVEKKQADVSSTLQRSLQRALKRTAKLPFEERLNVLLKMGIDYDDAITELTKE
jgi:hypothetical protein